MALMKVNSPKAVLLDLDDTILANGVLKEECWKQVKDDFSERLGTIDFDNLVVEYQKRNEWFWSDQSRHKEWRVKLEEARRLILAKTFSELKLEDRGLSAEIADSFSRARERAIRPFPGAIETIESLRGQGITTLLLTNGGASIQRRKIERFNLGSLFDHILIEGELGFGKPDTEIYRVALAKTGTASEETWMVGDNIIWDVLAPQSLGIKGVWIDNRGRPMKDGEEKPYLIVKSLPEIVDYIF